MESKIFGIFLIAVVCLITVKNISAQKATVFPTVEHKQLERLVGVWDVKIRFKVAPDKFVDGKATCIAKWVLDNHFVEQEYKSKMDGKPLTIRQMLGFDAEKKIFTEVFFNSMETSVVHNEGKMSADNQTISFTGKKFDYFSRQVMPLRTVYTFVNKDNFLLDWFLVAADGKEEKVVSLNHERRKKK